MPKVVIIGGNAAGMSCASKIKREKKDFDVFLFEKDSYVSYGKCGLPYIFSNEVEDEKKLFPLREEEIDERGIKLFLNEEAIEVFSSRKIAIFRNVKNGKIREEKFDYLVIASGSIPLSLKIPDFEGKNLFSLYNIKDALKIKEYLEKEKVYSATIIGAGFIGLELVDVFQRRGIKTTLISNTDRMLKKLNKTMTQILCDKLHFNGVKFLSEVEILEVKKENDRVDRILTNRGEVKSDIYVSVIGVEPNTSFLKGIPLSLGIKNSILVDERMRTNLNGIYACGDCCAQKNLVTQRYDYIPLGTTANKMGRCAGANIAGIKEEFLGVVGTQILKVFNSEIGITGITLEEAEKSGFKASEIFVETRDKASYYKNCGRVYLNVVVDENGKILGGQVIGNSQTKARIDTLATLITLKAKVNEVKNLDLAYSPPFSGVWDPLLIAFNNFKKR